jgi:hypothetical protein
MAELQHFGVPGMRWGVRKVESSTSASSSKGDSDARKKRRILIGLAVATGIASVSLVSYKLVNHQRALKVFKEASRKESVLRKVYSTVDLKNHYDVKAGANSAFVAMNEKKLKAASAMVERMAKDPNVKAEHIIAELDKLRLG